MPWTDAQRMAIECRESTLLVSAAAGSGKTAVLTERIVSLLREGAKIEEMLVVTFTRAAAAEMRGRILSALHDGADKGDKWLAQQAMLVERASISTLHAFCAGVCRDYFQAAGVDPTFRIADQAEEAMLRAQALEAALAECFEAPSLPFEHAALCFSQKVLAEAVEALYRFLMARPDPWDWMDNALLAYDTQPEEVAGSAWMRVLVDEIRRDAAEACALYAELLLFAQRHNLYTDFVRGELIACAALKAGAEAGYDGLMRTARNPPTRKPAKKKGTDAELEEQFTVMRDTAKKLHKAALDAAEGLKDLLPLTEELHDSGVAIAGIYEAARKLHTQFQALKAERNVLDYHDLEHSAYAALSEPSVSESVRAGVSYVFVDEYQDSSLLQEAIIARVATEGRLFMVGDVKQSIYKFRLAEPSLFLSKQESFSERAGALNRKIFLSENFRSRRTLLDAINQVFDRAFCGGAMELCYGEDERLKPGGIFDEDGPPVELHLISEEEQAEQDAEEEPDEREGIAVEAELIAQRILALRQDAERPFRLRDIAILMRTVKGKAGTVVETLRAHGIAAWTDIEADALERLEMQVMVSLLEVIDSLRQDIPLIAALSGPALGISEEELVTIRIETPQGSFAEAVFRYAERDNDLGRALAAFIGKVRGWALEAAVLPLDVFIRKLYAETGYYAEVGASPDGGLRQGTLRMLAEHAGAYQQVQSGGNLAGFLRYLSRVKARDGLIAMELSGRDDVVRVLSIHKSKGLQFPAVFVLGLGAGFGSHGTANDIQLHSELGVGLLAVNPLLRTKRPTIAERAIREKKRREALAEEARILYVAMTRAEERLILVGTEGKQAARRFVGAENAKRFLDWILPVAAGDGWRVEKHARGDIAPAKARERSTIAVLQSIRALGKPPESERIARALSFRPSRVLDTPLKQSVSSRMRIAAKAGEAEDAALLLESMPKRPYFMEQKGLTATERGDAVHAFLRGVSLRQTDAHAERLRMREAGILSQAQADALPMARLEALLQSGLWQRVCRAEELHREWAFNLREEAARATLLQGVIDCCFLEGGGWVLIDFKTDRSPETDAIVAHYRPQLAMYADALEKITGKPVKEKILYLVAHNMAVEVKDEAV